jgi:hypothetical protein
MTEQAPRAYPTEAILLQRRGLNANLVLAQLLKDGAHSPDVLADGDDLIDQPVHGGGGHEAIPDPPKVQSGVRP